MGSAYPLAVADAVPEVEAVPLLVRVYALREEEAVVVADKLEEEEPVAEAVAVADTLEEEEPVAEAEAVASADDVSNALLEPEEDADALEDAVAEAVPLLVRVYALREEEAVVVADKLEEEEPVAEAEAVASADDEEDALLEPDEDADALPVKVYAL